MPYTSENINFTGQQNTLGVWFFFDNLVALQLKTCFPNMCITADVIESQLVLALVLARVDRSCI